MERFGKYLLMQQIAEGGMGEVFLARQRGLADVERMVVLKRIRPSLREEEKFENLFLSEARISARLNHPNVVQLYEFGRIDESYFLTFEQIRGFDLANLRKRRPEPWPLDVTLELITQVLAGLSHVHSLSDFDGNALGIVHRDVSLPNVMVSMEGITKLLDFGVARSSHGPRDPERMVHGKFPYLSPEQCNFEPLDGRSDLFSLGAVMYELITGKVAFARATRQETMAAILLRNPPAPSTLRDGTPPVIDELCAKALQKGRDQRFRNADHMQAEVEQIAQTLGLSRGPRVLQRFIESVSAERPSGDIARVPSVVTETVTRSLLLVDDDEENLQALRRTFRSSYNLFFTTDPREALKIIADNVIHVVVSDQRMPGLTGVELLQQASQIRPGVLKVITSALSDSATLLSAINVAGIHRYVVKPWKPEELRVIVDELVSDKAGALALAPEPAPLPVMPEVVTAPLSRKVFAVQNAPSERTSVEPLPPMRQRQQLRPELIRAYSLYGHAAVVMVGLREGGVERADQVAASLRALHRDGDVIVRINDDKLVLVLSGTTTEQTRHKVDAARAHVEVARSTSAFPEVVLTATLMPEDAADPDEALMRASTALVIARKAWSS
ncbi:MAG: protein kinase [Polyangia bacterium]